MLHFKYLKIKDFFKYIFLLILFIAIFPTPIRAENKQSNIGLTLTPPLVKTELDNGEKFNQKFTIKYSNITNPKLTFNYFETDFQQTKKEPSKLFEETIKIKNTVSPDLIILDTEIDTINLDNKTYFFILEVLFNTSAGNESISGKIGVGIPMMLTVNKPKESANPKPDIAIKPNKNIYFTMYNSSVQTQEINQSSKLIEFGGEILVLDNNNTILYSEKISKDDNILAPKEVYQKQIKIPELPKKGIFPYYGKLHFAVRGTINGERHIETQRVSVLVIPYQLILAIIGVIILILFSSFSILRYLRKRRLLKHN